jgi:poly(A) polymerase
MKPTVIPRAQHTISRKVVDPDALRVMYRLLRSSHHAYLVGGAVRDLLLGRTPKDFDVGTDAHPHQVRRLFRNCRIVGRRFRLTHVHFGEKIIEVSTFRRRTEFEEAADGDRLIRSDNTFGTPEEDALRRDFTINGLFYDLETFSVIDYVGGIADLEHRVVRSIGDPDVRIPEDPVRILRAIKFAARLGFTIEPSLWNAMVRFAPDLHKCAMARVLEEIYRLLRGGAAGASLQLLEESGVLAQLLPEIEAYLHRARATGTDGDRVFWQVLETVDAVSAEGRGMISNPLLLGALAAPMASLVPGQPGLTAERSTQEMDRELDDLTHPWLERLAVARRDRDRLLHMLRSQPRFVRPRGRRFRPRSFAVKHYFTDALALFALGCRATGLELETLARWQGLLEEIGSAQTPEPRRRGRAPRRRGKKEATPAAEAPATKSGEPAAKPRWGRRHRRRRR